MPKPPKFKPRTLTVASGELTIAQIQATISGLMGKKGGQFKPRRLNQFERKLLLTIGVRKELKFDKQPDYIPKLVTDDLCDLCAQPLGDLIVCPRCLNCVYCGARNEDPHAQNCITCGNSMPGRSDDTDVVYHISGN